ncbi:MAG: transporter substrate-binding domain-containing protein [Alphaproteobacteria bacterium]|nr:transporter substrate-binding domain-containing protein [Alphaproteobacteria bacterium]
MSYKLRMYPKLITCLCMLMNIGWSISDDVAANKPATPTEIKVAEVSPQDDVQQNNILPIVDKKLRIGWVNFDPYYSLIKSEGGLERLTGLDAELVRAIAKAAGYSADYDFIQWGTQIQNLKEGKQHFAAAATFTEERSKFVYFSEPYRKEENSFYTRKGFGSKFSFRSGDMQGFIESLKKSKSKIALLEGMVYASPEINKFVADPGNKQYLVFTKNVYESIDLLLRGGVDGFLDDRILSSTAIWKTKNSDKIEEVYLGIGVPIHLMFSKKSVPESVMKEINGAIQSIKSDGTYSRVVSEYLFPVLILQTIERPWFFFLEAFAIMALVISGLLIAYREKFNLYGTMMIAFVSMSGGIIRDIMVNRPKLGIMLSPIYAIGILVSVVIGFVLVWTYQLLFKRTVVNETVAEKKWHQKHAAKITDWIVELLDAFGLAAYTVTGVIVALISQLDPLWLWGPILAVLTTTGGGIMRDIVRGQKDIATLKNDFYGEIAIIWGLILSLALTWNVEIMSPETMFNWIIFVVAGNFVTRLIVKVSGFKGLPFNLKGL